MDSLSPQVVSAAKLPILNPNEFDLWKMRIKQYFLMTDYSLWEVILNGDSPVPTRTQDSRWTFFVLEATLKQRLQYSKMTSDTEMYNDLCDYDQYCHHCGALFWYGERLKGRAYDGKAEYNLCCEGEGVVAGALLATEIDVAEFQLSLIWILTDHFT
nr:helitron helicase-like domain-containing protein [Tanacetum cinerariifolium]